MAPRPPRVVQKIDVELDGIIEQLETMTMPENVHDFSPILHRYVGMHSGVKMVGRFKTDDSSELGKMAYATFWRSENYAVPHDGVGLAWRKGDASIYNVYVVDNNTLNEDIFVTQTIIREDAGINNFIAAGKYEILVDTWYWFSLKMLTDNSIITKIWTGAELDEPADNAGPDPSYIIIPVGAKYLPFREGDEQDYQIGYGIENTRGSEWFFDDLKVIAIDSAQTYNIFQFKADPAKFTGPFTIKYYGYGSDENSDYGVTAFLMDSNEEWIEVGVNSGTELDPVETTLISYSDENVSNYIYNGYVYLATRPTHAYGKKTISTYYTSMENVYASGIHVGNSIDVWIDAPRNIAETTVSINSVNGRITISNVDFSTPIHEIVDIRDSGSSLLSYSDWTMHTEIGSAFSVEPNQYITLGGAYAGVNETFTIRYRYYQDGLAIQNLLDSHEYRTPGQSIKLKIKPPHVIQINNIQYRGLLTEDQVRQHIIDFVYNLDKTFEITDLISYLYQQGITYVDLDTLDIEIRSYDYKNVRTSGSGTNVTTNYYFDGLGSFYTINNELGVNKIT